MAGRLHVNAGRGGNDVGIEDDDALFNDGSFLAAIATVEAQHLGRLSSVLSHNGTRICGEEMNGGGGLDSSITGKRTVQWEGQNIVNGSPCHSLRGGNGPTCGYSEDDSRKRLRTEDDMRLNWSNNASGQEIESTLGSGRQPQSQQPEGEYMAALRGSNSDLWQSSGVGRGGATATAGLSNRGGASGIAASGGNFRGGSSGTCYKCGMEGHWAKECTGGKSISSPTKRIGANGHGAPNVQERLCPCGAGACSVLTANTEKNQGRSFYRCPLRKDEGQCTFFEWCDAESIPTGRINLQEFNQQPQLQCKCGGGPCTILTAKTEKNMGRQFYTCPLPQGCSFFQWCDEVGRDTGGHISSTPTRATSYSGNVASPAATSGSCYRCGREGHWSRDCPNQHSQNPSSFGGQSQSYSPRGSTEGKMTGNCYKCGGLGHWSTSCPNTGAPVGPNFAKPGSGSSTSGGSCYKCGDPGHWANRCPVAPGGQR